MIVKFHKIRNLKKALEILGSTHFKCTKFRAMAWQLEIQEMP